MKGLFKIEKKYFQFVHYQNPKTACIIPHYHHYCRSSDFMTFKLVFFCRTAELAIPETAAGEKVPVVVHLHGKKQFVLYCYM